MICIIVVFLGVLTGAAVCGTTRTARLKRMARTFNLRYDRRVETPITPLSTKDVKFFGKGFHHFSQVLTWKESGTFVRACEDQIFLSPLAKSPQASYTLWTAELTRGTFVPFVIIPRSHGEFPKDAAFPKQLGARYALIAPKGYQLSTKLVELLKTRPDCYIETTLYSLVYHEYRRAPVSQIQGMHFCVRTLVKELSQPPKPVEVNAASKVAPTSEELQASALLTLQNKLQTNSIMPGAARLCYVIIGLVALVGILIATRYFFAVLAR